MLQQTQSEIDCTLTLTSDRVSTLKRSISAAWPLIIARAAPKTGLGSYGSLKNKNKIKKLITILLSDNSNRIWANLQNQNSNYHFSLKKVPTKI